MDLFDSGNFNFDLVRVSASQSFNRVSQDLVKTIGNCDVLTCVIVINDNCIIIMTIA